MAKGVPLALSQNIKCNQDPVRAMCHYAIAPGVAVVLANGITRLELRFGFMEQPNVPQGLEVAMARGQIAKYDLSRAIYYTGHETIIAFGRRPGLSRWREELFASHCTIQA
jgi:KUP system potassium uptake protein